MSWRLRWAAVRYRFKESLFAYPTLLMLVGVVLAVITTLIDDRIGHDVDLPLTIALSSNGAMWLLSTVAGAMITTVGGLIVGILAYFGYNYLVAQISNLMFMMENATIDFMDLLHEPAGNEEEK